MCEKKGCRGAGDTFYFSFLHCARGESDNLETLIAPAYLEARNFFYSVAGNEQNSSIKTMVNSFTIICPQCRKRLDQTNVDIEDSPGTQAAAAYVCPPQLDEVRIRCDQRTKEVKA